MEVDASALRLYEADCGEKIAVANDMVTLTTVPLPARLLGVHLGLPGSDHCPVVSVESSTQERPSRF
ncbi:unnamed protein product [Symbiodinium sp. KB8]|nr:unnamed protein product [Symbiodinium sp. KB8]